MAEIHLSQQVRSDKLAYQERRAGSRERAKSSVLQRQQETGLPTETIFLLERAEKRWQFLAPARLERKADEVSDVIPAIA